MIATHEISTLAPLIRQTTEAGAKFQEVAKPLTLSDVVSEQWTPSSNTTTAWETLTKGTNEEALKAVFSNLGKGLEGGKGAMGANSATFEQSVSHNGQRDCHGVAEQRLAMTKDVTLQTQSLLRDGSTSAIATPSLRDAASRGEAISGVSVAGEGKESMGANSATFEQTVSQNGQGDCHGVAGQRLAMTEVKVPSSAEHPLAMTKDVALQTQRLAEEDVESSSILSPSTPLREGATIATPSPSLRDAASSGEAISCASVAGEGGKGAMGANSATFEQPVSQNGQGDCHGVAGQRLAMTEVKVSPSAEQRLAMTEVKVPSSAEHPLAEEGVESSSSILSSSTPSLRDVASSGEVISGVSVAGEGGEESIGTSPTTLEQPVLQNGQVDSHGVASQSLAGTDGVTAQSSLSTQSTISERITESLRVSSVAIVEAIQVSPTLKATGVGEIRIELSNEILDGSTVRFEVKKGGELQIIVHLATQDASRVLEKHLETFQSQLAERVTNWRVNVGMSAWQAKSTLKETERD